MICPHPVVPYIIKHGPLRTPSYQSGRCIPEPNLRLLFHSFYLLIKPENVAFASLTVLDGWERIGIPLGWTRAASSHCCLAVIEFGVSRADGGDMWEGE